MREVPLCVLGYEPGQSGCDPPVVEKEWRGKWLQALTCPPIPSSFVNVQRIRGDVRVVHLWRDKWTALSGPVDRPKWTSGPP